MDHGRVERRYPVGDAPVVRAASFGGFHQANHFRQEGVLRGGGCPHRQRTREVEYAGLDVRSGTHCLGRALAGDDRAIEVGVPAGYVAVDRYPFSGRDEQAHSRHEFGDGHVFAGAVVPQNHRAPRRKPGKTVDGRSRAFTHHMVKRAADKQEEEQRYRGVEIGVLTVIDGLIEAHRVGERHTHRDRHVHVHPAMAQCVRRGAEVDAAGKGESRNGDQRRQPMKQIPRRTYGARPDRHRQQHDVAGREACHSDGADQLRKRLVLLVNFRVEQVRLIAQPTEHGKEWRDAVSIPANRHTLRRQVDASGLNVVDLAERSLDRLNASPAMNRRHRQLGLVNVAAQSAAGQLDLVARRRSGRCVGDLQRHFGAWRAAAHCRAPFAIMMRRTSRNGDVSPASVSISTIQTPSFGACRAANSCVLPGESPDAAASVRASSSAS